MTHRQQPMINKQLTFKMGIQLLIISKYTHMPGETSLVLLSRTTRILLYGKVPYKMKGCGLHGSARLNLSY
jgi:hypothetical protein